MVIFSIFLQTKTYTDSPDAQRILRKMQEVGNRALVFPCLCIFTSQTYVLVKLGARTGKSNSSSIYGRRRLRLEMQVRGL